MGSVFLALSTLKIQFGSPVYNATVRYLEMFFHHLCTQVRIRTTKNEFGVRIFNVLKYGWYESRMSESQEPPVSEISGLF